MEVAYNTQGAALLTGLVALQTLWGVEFNTAVQRGDRAIAAHLARHGANPVDLETVRQLMMSVVPQPGG